MGGCDRLELGGISYHASSDKLLESPLGGMKSVELAEPLRRGKPIRRICFSFFSTSSPHPSLVNSLTT